MYTDLEPKTSPGYFLWIICSEAFVVSHEICFVLLDCNNGKNTKLVSKLQLAWSVLAYNIMKHICIVAR